MNGRRLANNENWRTKTKLPCRQTALTLDDSFRTTLKTSRENKCTSTEHYEGIPEGLGEGRGDV